jgi:ribose transport system substrate-binding protein
MKMRKALILPVLLGVAAGPALAQKKQLAIVVPGRDSTYYAAIGDGCAKWNADNKNSEYECRYAGPASKADGPGEIQIVDDLITTGAAAIAISPSDSEAMAKLLKAKQPWMPIMAIDTDFAPADKALRRTFLGTDNHQIGEKLAQFLSQAKPSGGTICFQLGKAGSETFNDRAAGVRDTLAGQKDTVKLTGQNGWSEPDGCPLFSDEQAALADKQLTEMLKANPTLDALVLTGAWAQTNGKAYAGALQPAVGRVKDKSLVIVGGDTAQSQMDALKTGRSMAQLGGQTPFDLGHTAPDVMIKLINGEAITDPVALGVVVCTPETLATCLK